MREITYRLAGEQDLEQTYQVFVTASNHLAAKRNLPQRAGSGAPPARALAFRRNALKHDSRRYWVAEDAGQIVGFGIGVLRQHLCYLAALHVLPDYQGLGIGRTLLFNSVGQDNAPGAQAWTTIADSLNPVSNGLYAQFGMYQWVPLVPISGELTAKGLETGAALPGPTRLLSDTPADLIALGRVDQQVIGVCRDVDHQLWLAQPDLRGYLFGDLASPQGYVYVSTTGAIGPIAVIRPALMEPFLAFCLDALRTCGVKEIQVKVPGWCRSGLRYLLAHGFRMGTCQLILSSEPFGHMDCYIPSGSDALL